MILRYLFELHIRRIRYPSGPVGADEGDPWAAHRYTQHKHIITLIVPHRKLTPMVCRGGPYKHRRPSTVIYTIRPQKTNARDGTIRKMRTGAAAHASRNNEWVRAKVRIDIW